MNGIEEKRARRLAFMRRLYDITDGRYLDEVSLERLATDLGWSISEINIVFDYLEHERLVESPSFGGGVSITHDGVREVEQSLSNPNQSTQHFPSLNFVAVHGDVIGSQIQSGTTSSTQSQPINWADERPAIETFLSEFRRAIEDPRISGDQQQAASTYVGAIESQLNHPEPDVAIVQEGLRSLRSIAENLAASGIFIGLVDLASQISL